MRGRKSNITIIILVIGVFLLCAAALVSFFISKTKTGKSFSDVELIEEMNAQMEKYSAEGDINDAQTRINQDGIRVFYQERQESYGFLGNKERIAFSAERGIDLARG
ncbi:hypothetical protein HYT23_02800 [Candidatus Pacearchaeota archaeon]|nr:hypothetical protein [Candidatus Pacearchaeota archaeon]